ncbi:GntR family transcriptional regulator [Ruminococcaceae bacterium OttesenSCG-928-D13]|nr:GntR family transcriptional regulator [Ruminococcaceae bacterium OttesenSCG-928-D13]
MKKHKYIQLAGSIIASINSGEYPVGAPLPGERELAEKYQYSRQTVRKAIDILCGDNVLKRIHGSGNFVLRKTHRPKSGMVAVVSSHIALPHFSDTLLSMQNTLTAGGFYPLCAVTNNRFDLERRVIEDLLCKNVDGLIVEGVLATIPNPNIQLYREIISQDIPLVFINSYYKEINEAVYVSMDNVQGGEACAKYLLSKGHTKFAGVFKADDMESVQRYSGLARYASEQGLPLSDNNALWYTSTNLRKTLNDSALSCVGNCSAVVCFNDEVAFELYEVLRRSGMKNLERLEFVAFDRTAFSQRIPNKITLLDYPQQAIGKLAAQKIMNMIQGKPESSQQLQWQIFDE